MQLHLNEDGMQIDPDQRQSYFHVAQIERRLLPVFHTHPLGMLHFADSVCPRPQCSQYYWRLQLSVILDQKMLSVAQQCGPVFQDPEMV